MICFESSRLASSFLAIDVRGAMNERHDDAAIVARLGNGRDADAQAV
jgi:hypothetical protein